MAYTDAEQLMMQGFEPMARAASPAAAQALAGIRAAQAPAGALYGPRGGQYVPTGYAESGVPYPTGNGFMRFMFDNMARPVINGGPRNFDTTLLMAPMWNYDNTVNAAFALGQQMMQSLRDPSFLKMMQGMMRPAGSGAPKQPGVTNPQQPGVKNPQQPADPNKMTPLEAYLHNSANRAARNPSASAGRSERNSGTNLETNANDTRTSLDRQENAFGKYPVIIRNGRDVGVTGNSTYPIEPDVYYAPGFRAQPQDMLNLDPRYGGYYDRALDGDVKTPPRH